MTSPQDFMLTFAKEIVHNVDIRPQIVQEWTEKLEAREKELLSNLIGEDEESIYDFGEATYGDTLADSASAYYGRNELRDELRRKAGIE